MSYERFVDSVSFLIGARLGTLSNESPLVRDSAGLLWERVHFGFTRTQGDVQQGMDHLGSEDYAAQNALNAEFDFFARQHEDLRPNSEGSDSWWPKFAMKAKSVVDSIVGILGSWLSDTTKRAFLLLKELLDLLS